MSSLSLPSPPQRHLILTRLFGEHHSWLRDRLRARLGCPDDAADMASETFAQVVAMPAPQGIREPRALLTTIAQRLMYDTWRRRDLERAYLEALAAMPEALEPSPQERMLVLETLEAIDRLLDGLSPRARTAFLCSQLDGMKYADIAAQLGVSTIRVRQYVAKGMLLCCQSLIE